MGKPIGTAVAFFLTAIEFHRGRKLTALVSESPDLCIHFFIGNRQGHERVFFLSKCASELSRKDH